MREISDHQAWETAPVFTQELAQRCDTGVETAFVAMVQFNAFGVDAQQVAIDFRWGSGAREGTDREARMFWLPGDEFEVGSGFGRGQLQPLGDRQHDTIAVERRIQVKRAAVRKLKYASGSLDRLRIRQQRQRFQLG
jgi:hypothetical protein